MNINQSLEKFFTEQAVVALCKIENLKWIFERNAIINTETKKSDNCDRKCTPCNSRIKAFYYLQAKSTNTLCS